MSSERQALAALDEHAETCFECCDRVGHACDVALELKEVYDLAAGNLVERDGLLTRVAS